MPRRTDRGLSIHPACWYRPRRERFRRRRFWHRLELDRFPPTVSVVVTEEYAPLPCTSHHPMGRLVEHMQGMPPARGDESSLVEVNWLTLPMAPLLNPTHFCVPGTDLTLIRGSAPCE